MKPYRDWYKWIIFKEEIYRIERGKNQNELLLTTYNRMSKSVFEFGSPILETTHPLTARWDLDYRNARIASTCQTHFSRILSPFPELVVGSRSKFSHRQFPVSELAGQSNVTNQISGITTRQIMQDRSSACRIHRVALRPLPFAINLVHCSLSVRNYGF